MSAHRRPDHFDPELAAAVPREKLLPPPVTRPAMSRFVARLLKGKLSVVYSPKIMISAR